ncbi:MAG: divalent-cation tolerance protein CutA [Saprospiraceae bacterium]|nr:divalent-cation tolerance protein CutA [Saprospiraceae bacterium]
MNKIVEVHLTFPNLESAQSFCLTLVEERLAACCTVFPVQSIYFWQSQIIQESEHTALLKTLPDKLDALLLKISSTHPYEIPAVTWSEAETTPGYLDWISETLND